MKAINILDDGAFEFYELCKKNEWTDSEYDDFDALKMFEGDPDMIRVNGELGFFMYISETDTVYYWFEESIGENIDKILIAFFEKRLGREKWNEKFQSWEYFGKNNAIAYRGGCGYLYGIYPLRIAS